MATQLAAPPIDDRNMWNIRFSSFLYPVVTVSHEIGLFAALKDSEADGEELAQRLSISRRASDVLTQMLWAMGFLERTEDRFRLTEAARTYLVPDSPFSWGDVLETSGEKLEHERILKAVRNDGDRLLYHGRPYTELWKKGDISDEAAREFTARMHNYILAPALGAAQSGVFDGATRILDVGGGSGAFSIALLSRSEDLQTGIFELPAVCKAARRYLDDFAVAHRVEVVTGNFLEDPFPQGWDGVLFSNIFHDWDRDVCLLLARKAFGALEPGGRIFLHEMLLEEENPSPLSIAGFSLNMFLNHVGKQYTRSELFDILLEAGFADPASQSTFGYYSVVSGVKN